MHSHYNVDIAHFEKKKKHRNILSNVPAQLYQGGDIRVYFVRLGQRSPEYMWEACAEAESFFFNLCSRKMLHVYITLVKIDHRIISPTDTQSASKLPHLIMVCSC